MFNGKMKAVTFSYDDGVTQDRNSIEMLAKYNLKCTFNLNSELLGTDGTLTHKGVTCSHNKVSPDEVKELYKNHEVAVHTLTHPRLPDIADDAEIIRQVEKDRENLSKLCGYEVIGMAYPCGGVNNDDRVAELIKNNTGVKYSRTITSSYSFDEQTNLYRFNPTLHHVDVDGMFKLAGQFISMKPEKPQIFYIWGHTYEFDLFNTWEKMDEFLKLISGHDDIFYGTNKEVLL